LVSPKEVVGSSSHVPYVSGLEAVLPKSFGWKGQSRPTVTSRVPIYLSSFSFVRHMVCSCDLGLEGPSSGDLPEAAITSSSGFPSWRFIVFPWLSFVSLYLII